MNDDKVEFLQFCHDVVFRVITQVDVRYGTVSIPCLHARHKANQARPFTGELTQHIPRIPFRGSIHGRLL